MQKKHLQNFGSQAQLGRSSPNNSPPMLCKKLQTFGSQALLVRTCYGHPKKTAEYWESNPACQILPILFSCHVSPQQKITVTFWEPSPAWQSTEKQDIGREEDIDQKIKLFFGKLEALLRENWVRRYMVTLLVWPWFGKVEALLREKCGIRMWYPKENGDRDRHKKNWPFWPLLFVTILLTAHCWKLRVVWGYKWSGVLSP